MNNNMRVFTLCFTGISGSGKTTLAKRVHEEFQKKGIPLQILDGDKTRNELGNIFGHTREERMKMNRVNRMLARYLNENGINVILAVVAPFEQMRHEMREYLGDKYVQAYLRCSYNECARRDVKGYYRKEKNGRMKNLNGANDIFEIPKTSEIVIDTEEQSVEESFNIIMDYLVRQEYIGGGCF